MRFFESVCTFDYPWNQVSAAHWHKYPNDSAQHVIAVDTLGRTVDTNGVLRTERLITCRQGVPCWVTKLLGGMEDSYVREVSEVDLRNQTLTLYSTNLTFSSCLQVKETVRYEPHPVTEGKTQFFQEAQIEGRASFKRLANKIEEWTVERFGQNAKIGRQGMESVLARVSTSIFRDNDESSAAQK